MRSWNNCGCEWRHMIAVAMNITTKRLIIHEAESTHKYHHKYPLEIHSTRKKNWNKRLTKHLGNLKKTLAKLQIISRWPRVRQCRGPVRMLLINKGLSPLVRIPAVTTRAWSLLRQGKVHSRSKPGNDKANINRPCNLTLRTLVEFIVSRHQRWPDVVHHTFVFSL